MHMKSLIKMIPCHMAWGKEETLDGKPGSLKTQWWSPDMKSISEWVPIATFEKLAWGARF